MFVIDPRDKSPLYEQLIRQLRWQVTMGFLSPNDPLPSVRQLSTELGINPNTIQKAYRMMEEQGLIYSRQGRGSFVTPQVSQQQARERKAQEERLREVLKTARDMGISREQVEDMVDGVYRAREEASDAAGKEE